MTSVVYRVKIWIVQDNEGNIEGLFLSQEDAQSYMDRIPAKWPRRLHHMFITEVSDPLGSNQ